jgi:biofilm PGA synthesis N-glycosyltransferase PgaC
MPTSLSTIAARPSGWPHLAAKTEAPIASMEAACPTREHTLRVVVLVPAYNEAGSIGATLDGLMLQSRPADLVVVIPNGCTDSTPGEARSTRLR